MTIVSVCPMALVAAPVEDVWELLIQPSRYQEWANAQLERAIPEGPVTTGQTIYLSTTELGKRWHICFFIESVNPDKHQIQLRVALPFGVVNHETITCIPRDAASCQVQYG